jgi:hypothetical protein
MKFRTAALLQVLRQEFLYLFISSRGGFPIAPYPMPPIPVHWELMVEGVVGSWVDL